MGNHKGEAEVLEGGEEGTWQAGNQQKEEAGDAHFDQAWPAGCHEGMEAEAGEEKQSLAGNC